MKLSEDRFSVPYCILDDDLPDKAFRLLVFLFKVSDCSGKAAPGYQAMKEGADITSRSTISNALRLLKTKGWFEFVKKGNGRCSVFFLRIPPRFAKERKKPNILSIRMLPK